MATTKAKDDDDKASAGKAEATDGGDAESGVPTGSPVVSPPTDAVAAAKSRNEQLYEIELAHSVAQHTETGRIVGLPDAVDPVSGVPLEDYKVLQPGDKVEVTYDQAMSVISAGYCTTSPYDTVAVDVLLSSPVNAAS